MTELKPNLNITFFCSQSQKRTEKLNSPKQFQICEVLSPNDVNKLVAELTVLHPTYGLENYAILGFSDVKTVAASSQTLMLMIGLYGTPFIALVFRKYAFIPFHQLNSHCFAEK